MILQQTANSQANDKISVLQLNLPFNKLVKNGAIDSSFNFLQIRLQNMHRHVVYHKPIHASRIEAIAD